MNATLDAPGAPGQRITLGRYDLLARLGRGGMADVYLGVARGLAGFQKLSVLKVLRPHFAHDEEFFTMFLDEARLSANFSHPHVVHTYGVEDDADLHFLVMEYLEGRSLSQLEAEQPDLPLPMRLRAIVDALHGLHYAHELTDFAGQSYNVVHRDVSPQNVFVTYGGRAKILDFGVAKARNAIAQTREGTYKGKVRYMAPEQLLGEPVDRRADVFSAGILLFRALTGRRLWEGLDQLAIMHRLASREPVPPPSSIYPRVPPELDEACARALSFHPDGRFATASEFAAVLEQFLNDCGPAGTHRGVALFLEKRYAEQRAQFQTALDERLRALRNAPVAVRLARASNGPPSGDSAPRSFAPGPTSVAPASSRAPGSPPSLRAPASPSSSPRGAGSTSGPPSPSARPRALASPSGAPLPFLGEDRSFSGRTGLTPSRLYVPPAFAAVPRMPPPAPDFGPAPSSASAPASAPAPSSAPAPTSISSPAPSPAAPPPPAEPRTSFAAKLGIVLLLLTAAIAPWWSRLWPQLRPHLQAALPNDTPLGPLLEPGPPRAAASAAPTPSAPKPSPGTVAP